MIGTAESMTGPAAAAQAVNVPALADTIEAVHISGLNKSYGALKAVQNLSLDIRRGEIFALLGPNGAGKTTTIEILEGYRSRDSGTVRVLGRDPQKPAEFTS